MRNLTAILVLVVVVLCAQPVFAQPLPLPPGHATEAVGTTGTVDWTAMTLRATGMGLPSLDARTAAERQASARRAATVVARRNLLEAVRGVHITSATLVENFMTTSDVVVAKMQGMVRGSRVVSTRPLEEDAVEVVVELALTGEFSEIVLPLVEETQATVPATQEPSPQTLSPQAPSMQTDQRLRNLEERVERLEAALSGAQQINAEQRELIEMLSLVAGAWMSEVQHTTRAQVVRTQADEPAPQAHSMDQLAQRITALATQVDALRRRLDALQPSTGVPTPKVPTPNATPAPNATPVPGPVPSVEWTGLVIDARDMGFRPCLRPEVYGPGQSNGTNTPALLYPTGAVHTNLGIRTGFVRYYSTIGAAQQSERSGTLPLTVRAESTIKGSRNLLLSASHAATLVTLANAPDSFLSQCRVVIVF